ncbi:MAG: tetratricopeptide repeat protein [Chloroflexi bacterium]|nr:tetratricopeptide repeat protein [Chloroflexota bacterium]
MLCMWEWWGQPTEKYTSGTEEEYEEAVASFRATGKPELWLFFRDIEERVLAQRGEQVMKVVAFRDKIEQMKGRESLLYELYRGPASWEKRLKKWLADWLDELSKGGSSLPGTPAEGGPSGESGMATADLQSSVEAMRKELAALRKQIETREARDRQVALENALEAERLRGKGRLIEAEGRYALALALYPESPDIHTGYGILLFVMGRMEKAGEHFETEAEEHYKRALALDPNYAMAHMNYAVLLAEAGRGPQAEEEFRRALDLAPNDRDAVHNYGVFLKRAGRGKEAQRYLRRAAALLKKAAAGKEKNL